MIKKITIIGSGNVATRLALVFTKIKLEVVQIISRNEKSGKKLAQLTHSKFHYDFKKIHTTDLIIICVPDDMIKEIIQQLPDIPMVHTSGNTDIKCFGEKIDYGVFYPLQSLNQSIDINFQNIPICIEANSNLFQKKLYNLAQKITKNIVFLDSHKRKHLHLAAVIAANFSNFSYSIAKQHLEEYKIDFSLLIPLIVHSSEKIIDHDPKKTQTGPAKRGDLKVLEEHVKMLSNPNHKKIYKLLSENILKEYAE